MPEQSFPLWNAPQRDVEHGEERKHDVETDRKLTEVIRTFERREEEKMTSRQKSSVAHGVGILLR